MSKIPAKRPPVPASPAKVVYRPLRSNSTSQQRNSVNGSFKIGDRVVTGGKTGTIAFAGPTKFAEGLNENRRNVLLVEKYFFLKIIRRMDWNHS